MPVTPRCETQANFHLDGFWAAGLLASIPDCRFPRRGSSQAAWHLPGDAWCSGSGVKCCDSACNLGLESVQLKRPLVIGKCLCMVSFVITEPSQGSQCPRVMWIPRQSLDQMCLGLLYLAVFFIQPGDFDLGIGRPGVLCRPVM